MWYTSCRPTLSPLSLLVQDTDSGILLLSLSLLIMALIPSRVLQVTSMIFMQRAPLFILYSLDCKFQPPDIVPSSCFLYDMQVWPCFVLLSRLWSHKTWDIKLLNSLAPSPHPPKNLQLCFGFELKSFNHIICRLCYEDAWSSQLQLRWQDLSLLVIRRSLRDSRCLRIHNGLKKRKTPMC